MLGCKRMGNGQRGSQTAKSAKEGEWRWCETGENLRDIRTGIQGKGGWTQDELSAGHGWVSGTGAMYLKNSGWDNAGKENERRMKDSEERKQCDWAGWDDRDSSLGNQEEGLLKKPLQSPMVKPQLPALWSALWFMNSLHPLAEEAPTNKYCPQDFPLKNQSLYILHTSRNFSSVNKKENDVFVCLFFTSEHNSGEGNVPDMFPSFYFSLRLIVSLWLAWNLPQPKTICYIAKQYAR